MSSPPEPITVRCPKCKLIYEDWYRPSLNLEIESFSDDYIKEATSATCPRCHTTISLDTLVVTEENEFSIGAPSHEKYTWKHLRPLQIGKYAEYLVKMEMTCRGLEVYSSEVDDHGVDFIVSAKPSGAKNESRIFHEIQVKSARKTEYVFFPKDKFSLRKTLFAAIVLFLEGKAPRLYLIPSIKWQKPNAILSSRDYKGKNSKPEWGLSLAKKHWPLLEKYSFESAVSKYLLPPNSSAPSN